MMYGCVTYKQYVRGLFTTGEEALACIWDKNVGFLMSTIDLEDGSGDGLITLARLI